MERKERNRTAILSALSKMAAPASSRRLAEFLSAAGHNLSERTVRLYLNELDAEGLTASRGKRKRIITQKGLAELSAAQTFRRVGYLSAKIDQMTYVNAMRARFPNHHFIIDTGRSGWPARAAGLPIENRTHRGNWCNVTGAGIGERPRADPVAGVDAYYWLKPPGESDGTSDSTQTTPDAEGKRYDPMCGANPVERPYATGELIATDALQGAPPAGHWFEEQFFMLVRNATPAL